MFKSYFLTTWRNLVKNKFYSLINIAGLTTGLAIGLLILLWVQDERSFDRFHQRADHLYRLENKVGTGVSRHIWTVTNAPIAVNAQARLPEVKGMMRMTDNYLYSSFRYNNQVFPANKAFFTDTTLFSIFDFPLLQGNAAKPFTDAHSVVMTEKAARKYFGKDNPLGKVIVANDKTSFTVSGVIKDFPLNSSIQGELFFPMQLLNDMHRAGKGIDADHEWEEFDFQTYLLLQPGTAIAALATRLRNIHLEHEPDDTDIEYLLQPLASMHLYNADGTDDGMQTVRIFTIIAVLILAISAINYVNLSTARAVLRAREVSVRKIIGAARRQLFFQFMIETAFLFLLSLGLALLLAEALLPLFNRLSGKALAIDFMSVRLWMLTGVTGLATLAVSSIYPALMLSAFEPLKALKGMLAAGIRDVTFRRVLVVGQFAISIGLITGTLIIGKQLHFMRTKNPGYDKEHVLMCWMPQGNAHYDAIRERMLREPEIKGMVRASGNIAMLGVQSGDNQWEGKEKGETVMVYPLSVEKDFIPFFKMQLTAGHNFSGTPADSGHYILNETAVKEMGLKDPVGQRFSLWKREGIIVGVIKDFHFASLREKIEPVVLYYDPQRSAMLLMKTGGQEASGAIAALKNVWQQYSAEIPFEYHFMDETFDDIYRSDQRTGNLFNVFAGIAIFVSCLGLLGLTAYTAQVRTREIGVRKVLGAGVSSIVRLLTLDFIRLILIANLIALPVSWWAMSRWLNEFAYRIPLNWTVFFLSGTIALLIALFTISFQSIRAAMANPVRSLKTE
ncbi:putative ABC transport system permease protein [Chitinophaga eiseniae]|uniref:Putative ABC transport system permease protein n=1 Tax=Chitinophaga eiseniae TaxID=634771 RepID=A0A1T4T073_9BACT|nr:ABC transporter permease [Chitinophaga eiseniae]SKA33864.1 putative ABC transport system permease protein [Chitinophaga eiseniae]